MKTSSKKAILQLIVGLVLALLAYWYFNINWYVKTTGQAVVASLAFVLMLIALISYALWVKYSLAKYLTLYWVNKDKSNPVKILEERYAKGEITKEQFESMKKDLAS